MRVVLDINVLLRGMFWPGGSAAAIIRGWSAGHFDLVTSIAQMAELNEVARRPSLRWKIIACNEPDATLERLWTAADPITLQRPYPDFDRDPKDAYILAMLRDGQVDYLVTEDHDLLALKAFAGAKIVQIQAFLLILRDIQPDTSGKEAR
jgi:putative PIN family toxin of toxin-antitoxin system